jgi:hypothetical protein
MHQIRLGFRTAVFALLSSGAAFCQVANDYELHKERLIGADVIEFRFSNPSEINDRAIVFVHLAFLDASDQTLASLDFGQRATRYYFGPRGNPGGSGEGWLGDE